MRVRLTVAVLALVASALPARGALFSSLSEFGKITNSSGTFNNLAGNRDMEPDPHVKLSTLGDDAFSKQKLRGSDGIMTLHVHSCSGPPVGRLAGEADATGSLYYEEGFVVRSATLAAGTPVTIKVTISAGSSFLAATTNPNNLPTNDLAQVEGSASVRIDSNQLGQASLTGHFDATQRGGFDDERAESGIFATTIVDPREQGERRAGEFVVNVGGKVGQTFNIALNASLRTTSRAGYFSVSEADAQISLLWGADVEGGLAELVASDDFAAPPAGNATGDRALIYLPVSYLPEPASLSAIGFGAGFTLLRRRPRTRAA